MRAAHVEPVRAELIEVTNLTARGGPHAANRDRAPFSLVFRAPPETMLPQQIFAVEHDDMGILEIFLVPIGPDHEGMRYEAIFT